MAFVVAYTLSLFLGGLAIAHEFAPIHARAERQRAYAAMSRPYFDTVIGPGHKGKFNPKHNLTQITDFRLPKLMHLPLTVWTYNCQKMSSTHKKDWDLMPGKQNHIWLMQGTQETYTPIRGTKPTTTIVNLTL